MAKNLTFFSKKLTKIVIFFEKNVKFLAIFWQMMKLCRNMMKDHKIDFKAHNVLSVRTHLFCSLWQGKQNTSHVKHFWMVNHVTWEIYLGYDARYLWLADQPRGGLAPPFPTDYINIFLAIDDIFWFVEGFTITTIYKAEMIVNDNCWNKKGSGKKKEKQSNGKLEYW